VLTLRCVKAYWTYFWIEPPEAILILCPSFDGPAWALVTLSAMLKSTPCPLLIQARSILVGRGTSR
jgi:hypothetical protein